MNRLIAEIEEQEVVQEPEVVEKPRKQDPENFFAALFSKGFISTDDATRALPFILYLSFLGMIYIANRHFTEKNLREIDKISKEVKELGWDYKSSKADLAYKSTLTEVAKRADTLGVHISLEPPQKIVVKQEEQK